MWRGGRPLKLQPSCASPHSCGAALQLGGRGLLANHVNVKSPKWNQHYFYFLKQNLASFANVKAGTWIPGFAPHFGKTTSSPKTLAAWAVGGPAHVPAGKRDLSLPSHSRITHQSLEMQSTLITAGNYFSRG